LVTSANTDLGKSSGDTIEQMRIANKPNARQLGTFHQLHKASFACLGKRGFTHLGNRANKHLITHHNQPSWRHFGLPNCEQIEGDDYGAKPHSISEGAF
jgi:hypothetical protein